MRFTKGMEVKVSQSKGEGVSLMLTGNVVSTDWPFVEVLISGDTEPKCFYRNDVFPVHYYTC
jgi:hypothetical protein